MYTYNSELIRVIDGDTIEANVDLGFNTWSRVKIRLYGIDAFESRTKDLEEKAKGLEAKRIITELLETTQGKFVLISKGLDKYGRSLGIILVKSDYAESGVIDANQMLVNEGLAKPYYGGTR